MLLCQFMYRIKTYDEFLGENLWADLQDRSSGEVTRKENYITTREELDELIMTEYEKQGQGDTLHLDFTGKKILVKDLSHLFKEYIHLHVLSGLETWDVSQVENMYSLFYNFKYIKELNIGNWDTRNVIGMGGMFENCRFLEKLDIGNWNTGQVRDMSWMFNGCNSLEELHIENWDVSQVIRMAGMFRNCINLKNLDIKNWDVSQVADMKNMFVNCMDLTDLDLTGWTLNDKIKIDDLDANIMFRNCPVWYVKRGNKFVKYEKVK